MLEGALKREIAEEAGGKAVNYKLFDVVATNIKWEMKKDIFEDLHHIGVLYNTKIERCTLKADADGLDSNGAK